MREVPCPSDTDLASPILIWPGKAVPKRHAAAGLSLEEIHGCGEGGGLLFRADSLDMLTWLLENGYRGSVDLVYIDPPFGGGSLYSRKVYLHGADSSKWIVAPAFGDLWTDGEYLQFLYERLVLLRELLSPAGSFYLHVDTAQAHYLKVICDEVFGRENFQREIVWRIGWVSGYKSQARNWIRNHDTILFYSKDADRMFFSKQYAPYAAGYARRGDSSTRKGHPLEDTWNCSEQDRLDSIQIKSFSAEKTGYPTQKNESLLERIIRSSCPDGGTVLDCFAGSGTAAAVAQRLGRKWIVGDVNPGAVHTTRCRMLRSGAPAFEIWGAEGREELGNPFAEVLFERTGEQVHIEIRAFTSPEVEKLAEGQVSDWRALVDCILVDPNYDGRSFRVGFTDLPMTRGDVVAGSYDFKTHGRIGVKLVDVLGGEALICEDGAPEGACP